MKAVLTVTFARLLPTMLVRPARRTLRIAEWTGVTVAIAAFVAFAVLPWLGVYRTLTVLSGSMRPTFSAGDVVITRAQPMGKLRVGDVITYQIPIGDHHLETHRVTRLWRRDSGVVVETQGDANDTADPWRARLVGDTVWREAAVIPKVGWAIVWLREPAIRSAGLYGGTLLLVVAGLLAVWRRRDDATNARAVHQQPPKKSF